MNTHFKTLSTNRPENIILVTGDVSCGLGCFKPKWLQDFANPQTYTFIFSIVGVLQSAFYFYFVGVASTLQKRFGFSGWVTGQILLADVLIPILLSLPVYRYVNTNKVHKSRLIASGMLLSALGCLLSAYPHFVYDHAEARAGHLMHSPKRDYCNLEVSSIKCEAENESPIKSLPFLFFLANFLNGFGNLVFYVIGIPYLSNIVMEKNSGSFFSAMSSLRIFGPVLGFLLSSFCLKFYEDPFYDPGIDPRNPRWVGAWWMGFLILGVVLMILSSLLVLFPRQLPERFRSERAAKNEKDDDDKALPKLKDFPQEFRRLIKNPILVCRVISVTFQVNGFLGYFVFMPKFMEAQYLQTASDASLFSGTTGILSMLFGIMLGGFVIMRYKPRPRYLTGYMVLVEIFSVLGLFISIFLGCDPIQMSGTSLKQDETLNLYNECNVGCSCTRRVFEPVCGEDGVTTYFSPCFAGCPNLTGLATSAIMTTLSPLANSTTSIQTFQSCKCTSGFNDTFITSTVTSGFCSSGCNMFIVYIVMLCISKFISATARVGDTLVTFRCVEAKDKSFALGTFGSVLAVFAFIPYPLIYGALTDSACLVWEETCSKTGNCWLYDSDKFRYYLHGMSMLLITIGIGFDGIVFLLSDRIKNLYGEDEKRKSQMDRIARWLKEEEEEDIIFTKFPKKSSLIEIDPVL